MRAQRVLICGGGIAGLTLGHWLLRHGFEPTILEAAPAVRGGGYMIDFWGLGYEVAERMGLLAGLRGAHREIPRIEFVDEQGRVRGGLQVRKLREMIGWRHFNLLRSGLERVLYDHVKGQVEVRFGTTITAARQDEGGVEVDLSSGASERFDLLVGADGLRSRTRRLLFGPDERYERYLGYYTASFTIPNYLGRDDVFQSFSVPDRQIGVYAVPGDQLATFFIFRAARPFGRLSVEEQRQRLREVFRGLPWEAPRLLDAMDAAPDFYFDAVSQVQMPAWSAGRVTLCGDACQCVSLISGQGSALAMAGAYVLAGELRRAGGDLPQALRRYEALMRPEIERKQQMARRFAASFVPASRLGIFVRDTFVRLMFLPLVSRFFISQFLDDGIRLEAY